MLKLHFVYIMPIKYTIKFNFICFSLFFVWCLSILICLYGKHYISVEQKLILNALYRIFFHSDLDTSFVKFC